MTTISDRCRVAKKQDTHHPDIGTMTKLTRKEMTEFVVPNTEIMAIIIPEESTMKEIRIGMTMRPIAASMMLMTMQPVRIMLPAIGIFHLKKENDNAF